MDRHTYSRASNLKLAVVETGCHHLYKDVLRGKLACSWYFDVLLVLQRGFEALLAGQNPLSSHGAIGVIRMGFVLDGSRRIVRADACLLLREPTGEFQGNGRCGG